MDTSGVIQLIILAGLLMLSAFFSSAETALTTVNKIRIRFLAEEGKRSAIVLERVLESPGKMLSTILIGNNIVNISATSLATALTIRVWGNVYIGLVTGILTIFVLLFGEIVPKTWASMNPEKLSLWYGYIIFGLMNILTPVIYIVDKLSGFFLKIMGIDANQKVSYMTENELKTYVDVSHEDGVIESEEREMILNVFDFGDSCARDIMVPRIDVDLVDVEASHREVLNIFKKNMYSRIPVYENETDNIIGIINLKDFFLKAKRTDFSVRTILRETYYTYEYKKTNDLLMEMREGAINFAVILDEYGACVGIVTMEDLLEEIVGEIRDEYDESEEELIQEIGERTYLIEGSMKLDDINDAIQTTFDSEDYDSIGGIIIEILDRLPKKDEEITLPDGTKLIASIVKNNRIEKVTMMLPKQEQSGEDATASDHTEEGEEASLSKEDAIEA